MSLLGRCQDLHKRIEKHNELQLAHAEAEDFRVRVTEIKEIRESLESVLSKVRVLKTKGIRIAKMPDPKNSLDLLNDASQFLVDGSPEFGKCYGRLKRAIDNARKGVIGVVEKALESVGRDFQTLDEPFLRQVEQIPAYKDKVSLIRLKRDELRGGIEAQSKTAGELEQFLDRRDQLRRLADELKPDEFPEEVLKFYSAARNFGAPLDKLTDTVKSWLQEHNELKNIRIIVR
jgi:hypothetical protein